MGHQFRGFEVKRIYGTTSDGKRYVFIITKIVWFASRLIIEPFCYDTFKKLEPATPVERVAFYFEDQLDAYVKKRVAELEGTAGLVDGQGALLEAMNQWAKPSIMAKGIYASESKALKAKPCLPKIGNRNHDWFMMVIDSNFCTTESMYL